MNDKDAAAAAAVSQLSAALAPMGCLIGIVQALFWLVMIGLIIFCAWLWSLR